MLLPDQLTVEVELTDDHVAVLPEGFYRLETTYRSAACVFYVTVKGMKCFWVYRKCLFKFVTELL